MVTLFTLFLELDKHITHNPLYFSRDKNNKENPYDDPEQNAKQDI